MAEGKQIKITALVDEASFAKSIRMIRELTSQVTKLVEATQKVNLGFGMGGGGGGGARVSGTSAPAGSGSSMTQVSQRMNTAGGGLTDNLSRAVTNSAQLFKAASTGTTQAFKIMSDALRSNVNESDREIKRLTSSLQGLEKSYDRLKQRQASGRGGALTDAAIGRVSGDFTGTAQQLNQAQEHRAKAVAAQEKLQATANPGLFQRARGALNESLPSVGGAVSSLRQIPGFGGLMNFGSSPLGLGMAAFSGASAVLGARNSNEMANLNYQIDRPMFGSGAKGQLGQIFGGNAMAIRHGDLARSMAMSSLKDDPAMKAIVSDNMRKMLVERRNGMNPVGATESLARGGGFGGLYGAFKDNLGVVGQHYLGTGGQGGTNLPGTGVQQVARDRAAAEQIAMQSEMFQKRLEAKMQEDPMFNDRVNRQYSGAFGQLSLARASGVSNSMRSVVDAGGNRAQMRGTDFLKATAESQGYDVNEYVGGMQQMGSTVGRSFMHRGTSSLLSAQAGGLSNIAQLRAAGSQYNGGDYGRFERNIQGRIGRGGVDITAASQISGMGAGMMQGQFSGTGVGLMSTLLDAGYTGNGAGDMRMARAIGSGVGAIGNMMSGGIDPLQKALNASAAMAAAPGASQATKNALMSMDPGTAMDAIKNGRVPENLKNMGVTMTMLQKYVQTQDQTAFSRVSPEMMAGTKTGAAVAAYKAAGGLSFLAGKSKTEINSTLRALAPGLRMAGGAATDEAALGRLTLEASMGGLLGRGRGRGAHGAGAIKNKDGSLTIEGAVSSDVARNTAEEGMQVGADGKLIVGGIANMGTNKTANERARRTGQAAISGASPEEAANSVAVALQVFITSIKGVASSVGGSGRQLAPRGK